jgi:hypothetical protein
MPWAREKRLPAADRVKPQVAELHADYRLPMISRNERAFWRIDRHLLAARSLQHRRSRGAPPITGERGTYDLKTALFHG